MKKISILCVLMITCGNAIAADGDKWDNYKTYWDRIDYSHYNITNYNEGELLTVGEMLAEVLTQSDPLAVLGAPNNLVFEVDHYGTIEKLAYNCSDDYNHPEKQYWNIYDGAIINWIDGGWRTAKVNKGLLFYDNHFSESDAPPPGETCINDSFVTKLSGQSNTRKYFRKIDGNEASMDNQLYSAYVGTPSDVCITYRCAPGYRMMADPTNEYSQPEDGTWCKAENTQCPFYRGDRTYYMRTDEAFGNDGNAPFNCIESSNNKGVTFGEYQGYTKGRQFLTITGGLIDQMTSDMQNTTCTDGAPHCTVEKLNTACGKLGYRLKDDGTETKVIDGTAVLISACRQAQSVFEYKEKYKVKKDVFDNRDCDFMCEYDGISVNVRKKERMNIEQSLADNEQKTEYARCPLFFTDSYNSDDELTCVYDEVAVDTLVNAINGYIYDKNKKASEAERSNAIQACARNFCTASGGVYNNDNGNCLCGGEPCNTKYNDEYSYCEPTQRSHCVEGVWTVWNPDVPTKKERNALVNGWKGILDGCIADADNAYNSSINGSSTTADSTNATDTTASISDLAGRLALVEGQFGLSKWRTADGKFNTARLASDLTAGVVLGTTGALVTSSVVKKKQVKDGFESLECTVGGQHVGDWGDVFRIDGK